MHTYVHTYVYDCSVNLLCVELTGLKFLIRLCTDMGLAKQAQEYAVKLKKAEKVRRCFLLMCLFEVVLLFHILYRERPALTERKKPAGSPVPAVVSHLTTCILSSSVDYG